MKNCQTTDETAMKRSEPQDVNNADQRQITYLKVADYPAMSSNADLSKIPKRKLSVFYRSFDVIAQIDQEEKKTQNAVDFRRTFSSPSVKIEMAGEEDADDHIDRQANLKEWRSRGFADDEEKLSSSSLPHDRLRIGGKSSQVSKADPLSPVIFKLPQVLRQGTITEAKSIGKRCKSNDNENRERRVADESVRIDCRHNNWSPDLLASSSAIRSSFGEKKVAGSETNSCASTELRRSSRFHAARTDLVKIKDSKYPRSFVNASSAGRLGKYTSVDGEMSSHEDSSIGSDSEDDPIETCTRRGESRIDRSRSKNHNPFARPSSFSMDEPSRKSGNSREIHDQDVTEEDVEEEFCSGRVERQKCFAARRSLSEGDCERYHRAKRRCRCVRGEEEPFEDEEREKFPAFPSFNDTRLQIMGLSCSNDIDSVYRENLPENELERKYIAFSIGLGTDRITLHQRMILSLRQRDQSERNFMEEIKKMQEDIKSLCPLCTDQESIDKVENIRHRLDMITRSAHRVSCAAETLGAVYQEHRISRAIFIGDKYLHLLRSRCENLAADIADVKQILLKNNIMIEETGEMADDLPRLRYRNGLPCNNRTMMTRRRASIATISRPLSSQDVIKEIPRQRNSVSGRVNLRRPSLCFETQKWENEKLNRTDSANSVVELRDIFEQTESRRNSVEENNNLLRNNQSSIVSNINCDIASKDKDRLIIKQNSFLESSVTNTVEKQLKSCIRTTEPLRITGNIETWRPILWFTFIFFLGFYAKQITLTFVT